MINNKEKEKLIRETVKQIEKDFGKGIIQKLGNSDIKPIPVLPTGSLLLDIALGVGGYPKGRIVEIFGPEMGGKTMLSLAAIGEAQKKGLTVAFVDAEYAFDPGWAKMLGVDVSNLHVVQPDYGEQALKVVERLVQGGFDLVVIDSVTALVPKKEAEGEIGDTHIGLQARMMSQALRMLCKTISKMETVVIFINQIRMKIGILYGNPETTPGGKALRFYSSVRLRVSKSSQGAIKDRGIIVGHRVKIRVAKNKVAPPFKIAEFDLLYNSGIDTTGELFDAALSKGIIHQAASSYVFEDCKWKGAARVREAIKGDEKLREQLIKSIREKGTAVTPLKDTQVVVGDDDDE